jgi:hypothetical protein
MERSMARAYDRFRSTEPLAWNRKCFREGVRKRQRGFTLQANPYTPETHASRSWAAGWADEDQMRLRVDR